MPSFYNNYNNYFGSDFLNTETENKKEINNNLSKKNNNTYTNPNTQAFFELFGIKLFIDDIIIIGLLFFLYKEGVHDELLFIVLIMLLLN